MQESHYSFSVNARGEINNRFEIVFKPNTVLSNHEVNVQGIKIYKVETGYRIIANQDVITVIELWDMSGKLIKSITPNTTDYNFETQSLQKGVYLMKVKSKKKQLHQKIIL